MLKSTFLFRPAFNNFGLLNPKFPTVSYSTEGTSTCKGDVVSSKGLILGVYSAKGDKTHSLFNLTRTGKKFDIRTGGRLHEVLQKSGQIPEQGETRLLFGVDKEFSAVAIVGLGDECKGYDDYEEVDMFKEIIRTASGSACRTLQNLKVPRIFVESFGHAESAAEGAALSTWIYQTFKNPNSKRRIPLIELFDDCDIDGWKIGLVKAEAQNLARELADTPANLMTPTTFAQNAVEVLTMSGVNVEVKVQGWAETMDMGAFLSVAKGGCEPPIFLELSYYGAEYSEKPIVLVGKGITFNSGGICLNSPQDMQFMRGDMSGAAIVLATIRALAALQLPMNVRGLIPLCENMPGCDAYKPGDLITAMNGKEIVVEDTNCAGRLILSDALNYAQEFSPHLLIDVGTMTKCSGHVLGTAATPAFTTSEDMWERIRRAGIHTGDRLWRLPLWEHFRSQVKNTNYGDLTNVGSGRGGGVCKAAAFLREFVPPCDWIHLDTFGVMTTDGQELPYLRRGMSGRPTRTLIEFISELVCVHCSED